MDGSPERYDEPTERPMTAGWSAVVLAVVSTVLVVGSQVWARRTNDLGPLLPLLGGLVLGAVAGVVGLVGLLGLALRGRRDRLELGLCLAGTLFGVACVVLALA